MVKYLYTNLKTVGCNLEELLKSSTAILLWLQVFSKKVNCTSTCNTVLERTASEMGKRLNIRKSYAFAAAIEKYV